MKEMVFAGLAALMLAGPAPAQQQHLDVPGGLAPEMFAARIEAGMAAGREARLGDLRRFEAAVAAEPRRDAWAKAEEARLKQAFAGRGALVAPEALRAPAAGPRIGAAALAGLDCRATRCAIEVTLPPDLPPERHVAELQAVEAWLAVSQPCGYTLVLPAPGSDEPVRAFTDCGG